ncbi:TIM-barrel domain-containing protein [Paenibacillus thermoaerophilus]|uniref:TIM-barrel domain-containing protein n=1 Tax=Paenibacillus thermoaerophilus TaxID=1215385 RepID=A0ABW2V2K8_9BACL|nr:TIM-barrel domain-containing protein [Paenibacillus thermoaerophilus]TMV17377.1 carbohydrate-binding protein [Paenibacillus thermoaerophilus]
MRLFSRGKAAAARLLAVVLAASLLSFGHPERSDAYAGSLGNVLNASVAGDKLTLTIDNGAEPNDDILELLVAGENILKVDYRPNGVAASPDTPMIDPNKTWSAVGASIDTSGNPIVIATPRMRIEIAKFPARLTVKKADGTTLLWEPPGGGVFYDGIRFMRSPSDNLYGIRGWNAFETVDGGQKLLRNNNSHGAHAGEQGDAGGPFVWSTRGYGLLVDSDGGYPYTDSTGKLEFYYGGTPAEGRRYAKNDLEYYIMLGDPKEIMGAFAEITGKSPMMPKWSLGFSNFEWNTNQTELTSMVDTYRAKNIPLDSYGLDYDWKRYGENNYGEFKWNTANFPSAATNALKASMDARGVKMIGITKPRIVTKDAGGNPTIQYADAESGGYWYPGHFEYQDYFIPVQVRSIDPYNPAARSWYWDHSKEAFDKGIVGWWNDETDKVSSGGVTLWFGNFTTTHLSQAMYEGQRAYTNGNARVWQTARTFYPGAQRYATTHWSGDIGIQFYKGEQIGWAAGMQEQRAVLLSAVNMGQPKVGMDAGGFNKQDGTTYNPSPELYARWLQFSAFTPVFRVHGNNGQQRQPWFYGSTAEEAAKSAIRLRYSLLPYMYAYERSAYENGVGLMRPLMFEFPSDSNVADTVDAWMFGDYLLAAPVVDKGQTVKNIYLPAGTWIDYFRGTVYTGGQTIAYPVNADSWSDIPLFIRKGAIIPTQKVQDYVGQSAVQSVDVDVFADMASTSFTYYDDDGSSYQYESGNYFKQKLTARDNGASGITLDVEGKTGTYAPALQYYVLKIHGKAGTSVKSNGVALTSYADLNALRAASGEGWAVGKDIYGDVTYVKIRAAATSGKSVAVSGSAPVSATSYKYEAEDASLSGNTVATKATVNNNHAGYSGSGFADGLGQPGAAVTFYADVKTAGDYSVALRYANATGSDKSLSVFVNGKRIKTTVLGPLANWDTWATKTETIPMEAGRNAITYKYLADAGDTGNVNLDYITVPFQADIASYEAESALLGGGASVNRNHWNYSGTGFVDGMTAAGASAEFEVTVPSAGTYEVVLRYANGTGSAKTLSTYVNGAKIGQVSFPSPGSDWNAWERKTQSLALNAGRNRIAFKYDAGDSGNINLDRLLVSASAIGPLETERNLLDNGDFERPSGYSSGWTEWHPTGQALAYGVDGGLTTNPPEAAQTGSNRAYFWASGAYQQSIHQVVSVPVNNANYRLEAWVRLKNATPTVARAEISGHGGSAIYANITNDGVWKLIRIDNIFVTSGQIDVGFYVNSPGGTTLHIDDVRLVKP